MSGESYIISDQNALYFVTFTVVGWIDFFTRRSYKLALGNSLNYCVKKKGLRVYAWCVMSNHVHLIVRANEGFK